MKEHEKLRNVILGMWSYGYRLMTNAYGDSLLIRDELKDRSDTKYWALRLRGVTIAIGRNGGPAEFFRLSEYSQKGRTRLWAVGVEVERKNRKTYAFGRAIEPGRWYRAADFRRLGGVAQAPTWEDFQYLTGLEPPDGGVSFQHVVVHADGTFDTELPVMKKCDDCGWWFMETEMDHGYCQQCKTKHVCSICGLPSSNLRRVDTQTGEQSVCDGCIQSLTLCDRICERCGCDVVEGDDVVHGFYHGRIIVACRRCAATFTQCPDCGHLLDLGESCRCQDPIVVHAYHWGKGHDSYSTIMFADGEDRQTNVTLGVELEMGLGDVRKIHLCQHAKDLFNEGLIHFERDGSLRSVNGVEMITVPCTLKYHAEDFGWPELCRGLVSAGFRSHDKCSGCCGFHIHIGRNAFSRLFLSSQTLIDRLDALVNSAWQYFSRIGRRNYTHDENESSTGPGHYAGFKPQRCGKESVKCDRYKAVNQTNDETIELRFPKGTLNPETILGTLAMATYLPDFCSSVSEDDIKAAPLSVAKQFHDALLADEFLGRYYRPMAERLLPPGVFIPTDGEE